MEVTTVSPSPASLTEGDDLCETDVSNVAIHSVTLLICLCGLAGNGAVLWILSLKSRNYHIFELAIADFLFLLFTVPSAFLFLVEDVSCNPIVPLTYVRFVFQLPVFSFYWGMFWLCADVGNILTLCTIYCYCRCPQRVWQLVGGIQSWAFFAFFAAIPVLTSLCPSHEKDHCRAALISMYTVILLLLAAPVVIVNTSNIIRATCGFKKQQLKRREVIVFIIVIFTFLLFLWNFLQQLGYLLVSTQIYFLLTCIHSSIKPFIYFLAGRCSSPCSMESLRLSLQRVFEEEKKENTAHSDDDNSETGV